MKTRRHDPVKHTQKASRIAYGYARVSKNEQVDGESLGVQQEQIKALATLHGYTLAGIFIDDGISASRALRERPEGRKLWKAVKSGDAIIAKSLDRSFRNQADALNTLADCKRNNISLVLGDLGGDCTTGSVAELLFSIVGAFANFELNRIAERILDAKQAQKARGEYLGGTAPFGYHIVDRDGVRRVEADNALHIRVLNLHQRQFSSRMISAELKVKDGIGVSAVTICKFLRQHAGQTA